MHITYPNDDRFVGRHTYSKILEAAVEKFGTCKKDDDYYEYKNKLTNFADSLNAGFAFTFYYAENYAIGRITDEKRRLTDIDKINNSYGNIRSEVNRALNDYLLAHNGVIDSWPYPENFDIYYMKNKISNSDDYDEDEVDNIYFTYNFFYSGYIKKTDEIKYEKQNGLVKEKHNHTYTTFSRHGDGYANHVFYNHSTDRELHKMNIELTQKEMTIKYTPDHIKHTRFNNFKKFVAAIPAFWIIINALAIIYWCISGKQNAESLTLFQYIGDTLSANVQNEFLQVLCIILLIPTYLCVFLWGLLNNIAAPFNIIANIALSAVLIGIGIGIYILLSKNMKIDNDAEKICVLKKEFIEAKHIKETIISSPRYIELCKEGEEKEAALKAVYKEWADKFYNHYISNLGLHEISDPYFDKHFRSFNL